MGFKRFHPFSQLLYFVSVIVFPVFFMHPIILLIYFVTGIIYGFSLKYKNFFGKLKFIIPMFLLVAIINPMFSHGGVTVLCYLPDGNLLTFESIIFGIFAAVMMAGVMIWFFSVNDILTSDRIIFLFGRISPRLALLISMVLGFIPKLDRQLNEIKAAQYSLSRDIRYGSVFAKIKKGISVFLALIQWSLENSIDTADSMKSRGYGTGERTSFSRYKIMKWDIFFISACIVLDIYISFGAYGGYLDGKYYPSFVIPQSDIYSVSLYISFSLICIMPFIIDFKEETKWKSIMSKI